MGISAEKFLALTQTQIDQLLKPPRCHDCKVVLRETVTGCRKTKRGYVCSDCYFKELGAEVERHPIAVPRMHRGT